MKPRKKKKSAHPRKTGSDNPNIINCDGQRVVRYLLSGCLLFELLLIFLDATVNYSEWTDYGMIRRLTNIIREDGLATWFSWTQTLMVGFTLLGIYFVTRKKKRPKRLVTGWLCLSIIFLFLAFDDGVEIHERAGSVFEDVHVDNVEDTAIAFTGRVIEGYPSHKWHILYFPVFCILGPLVFFFLWRQFHEKRARVFILLATSFFVISFGLDFLEELERDHPWNVYTALDKSYDMDAFTERQFHENPYDTLRHFSRALEESLEMLGMTLLWAIFLLHFMRESRELIIEFKMPSKEPGKT